MTLEGVAQELQLISAFFTSIYHPKMSYLPISHCIFLPLSTGDILVCFLVMASILTRIQLGRGGPLGTWNTRRRSPLERHY